LGGTPAEKKQRKNHLPGLSSARGESALSLGKGKGGDSGKKEAPNTAVGDRLKVDVNYQRRGCM